MKPKTIKKADTVKKPKPLRYQAGMFKSANHEAIAEQSISKLKNILLLKLAGRILKEDAEELSRAVWNFLADDEDYLELQSVQDQADFVRLATNLIIFLFDCGFSEGVYAACTEAFRRKDGEMNEQNPKCQKLLDLWRTFDYH